MKLEEYKAEKMKDSEFVSVFEEIQPELMAIRVGMSKEYEKVCLNALNTVLKEYVPTTWYSVGGAKESAACLEEEGGWIVYDFERGNRFSISKHDNIIEACLDLVRRVGGKEQAARLIDDFLSMVIGKTNGDEPA